MVVITRWLLLAIAAAVLVVHSLAYNFVTDDAYISFVFSRNFAEHGELVFNLGDYVEGYTNFLWTVMLGVLMLVGIPPEISARVLGTACAIVTLWLVFRIVERALGRRTPWAAVPSLLLASSSGFACWSSGGLETQLFTMLVVAALDSVVAATEQPAAIRRAGIFVALAAMTRPEGILVGAVLGLVRLVHLLVDWRARRKAPWDAPPPSTTWPLRDDLIALGLFLALWAPWFAWRWWYYGYPFPNTYYVKASGKWTDPRYAQQMVENGAHYILVWLRQTKLVDVAYIAFLGLIAGTPRSPRFVLALACSLLSIVYVAYAISVGGDFMGLHRFIMPVFVTAAIAVVLGVELIAGRIRGRAGAVVSVVAATALVGAFAFTQYRLTRWALNPGKKQLAERGIDTPAFLIMYTEDRATIGRAMRDCFRPDDFSIVGGAGAQPYFARMRAIDVFGLVSDRIAHGEPRVRPRAGHTKWGSDAVLASYDPELIFSCYVLHTSPAQPQLPCGQWRARGYEQVTMQLPRLREHGPGPHSYYTFLAKKARNFQCPGRVH